MSDLQIKYSINKSKDQIINQLKHAINLSKNILVTQFTAQDLQGQI